MMDKKTISIYVNCVPDGLPKIQTQVGELVIKFDIEQTLLEQTNALIRGQFDRVYFINGLLRSDGNLDEIKEVLDCGYGVIWILPPTFNSDENYKKIESYLGSCSSRFLIAFN
ncbi:Uncharacterised protein [uncultured archaeon]|nr:Uncharacterised protein [uncultured archaeon]